MTMIRVVLDTEQWSEVRRVAAAVESRHRRKGTAMRYREERSRKEISADGFAAELAVAIGSGQIWHNATDVAGGPDVGDRTEVRHTRQGSYLLVYPDDPDSRLFVLVVGFPPKLDIVGWLPGTAAKERRYWRAKGPRSDVGAYWIPDVDLRSFVEFPDRRPGSRPALEPRACPSCLRSHSAMTVCSPA